MLQLSTLRDEIATLCGRRRKIKFALFVSWSCDMRYVDSLVEEFGSDDADITVVFQRHAYPVEIRGNQNTKAKKHFVLNNCAELNTTTVKYYKTKGKRATLYQVHCKFAFVVLDDGHTEYIQPSSNLVPENKPSLLYRGFPIRLKYLSDVLVCEKFLDTVEPLCTGVGTPEMLLATLRRFHRDVTRIPVASYDLHTMLVVTAPTNFELGDVFTLKKAVQDIFYVCKSLKANREQVLFRNYLKDLTLTTIVSYYNFVDVRLLDSICNSVASIFTSPDEQELKPLIATVYADNLASVENPLQHEKFVYKVHNETNNILWVFVTSHNLTPASWESQLSKNLEVGVMVFPTTSTLSSASWKSVQSYLLNYYFKTTSYTKVHRTVCQRPVVSSEKSGQPATLKKGNTKRAAPLDNSVYEPTHTCPVPCRHATSAFQRFRVAKECLVNHLLKNRSGLGQLTNLLAFNTDNYTRYALYDHVFNDLAGQVTWVSGGTFNTTQLRKHFRKRAEELDVTWYSPQLAGRELTLETLVDTFRTWGYFFELYSREIMLSRPIVNENTLVHYGEVHESKNHTFLEDPAYHNYRDNNTNAYDALSFLVQNMLTNQCVWFRCTKVNTNHEFYTTLKVVCNRPHCMVCETTQDTQLVYQTLREYPEDLQFVTVEFPLHKRLPVYQQVQRANEFKNVRNTVFYNEELQVLTDQKLKNAYRFDVFFAFGDYVCAVELDDVSHRELKRRSVNAFGEPVRTTDAVKTVMAHLYGIHVLRIETVNTNSRSLVPTLVKEFLGFVRRTNVTFFGHGYWKTFQTVYDSVKNHQAVKNRSSLNPVKVANPVFDVRTNDIRLNKASPVSMWLTVVDSDKAARTVRANRKWGTANRTTRQLLQSRERNTLELYLQEGTLHASFSSEQEVPVSDLLDVFSVRRNYCNILQFLESRTQEHLKSWFELGSGRNSRQGRLFESDNGVVVLGQYNQSQKGYEYSEFSDVYSVDNVKYTKLQGLEDVPVPYQYVRLYETFQKTTTVNQYKLRSSHVKTLEQWIAPKKKVWVVNELEEGGEQVEQRTVESVGKDQYGKVYVTLESSAPSTEKSKGVLLQVEEEERDNTVLSHEISKRLFRLDSRGQRVYSKYTDVSSGTVSCS